MNTERNARIRRIFSEVVEMSASQRETELERACAGDEVLRAAVRQLLDAHNGADGFMKSPTASLTAAPITEGPGSFVGPYKLLQEIGEGGFGTVFLAEQDHPLRRRVALKIIKLGMDTRQVIARFEAERQALAMMEHPNIARVLDGGATDSGRPYFVMEYVVGDSITAFADAHKLSVSERLTLFGQVCAAVQHAHTKGIIHRDIKPGNVLVSMVDGRPHAKVIDFGIVKATGAAGGRLTDKTLFTEHRQLIGTPEYMSPEQAGGAPDIDTRTDVYALGVLLYELLTGATPIDGKRLRSAAFDEMRRIIREEDPVLPSLRLSRDLETLAKVADARRAEPGKLGGFVRGELDWIVMKALEKDRARRYESASQLAADVQRHLDGEAVIAAPVSTAYKLRKFVRRNKGVVIGGSAVAAVLVLGIAGTTTGLLIAQYNAEAALKNADLAMQARDESEWSAYTANLALAQNAMDAGNWPAAREFLEFCPDNKRGWEWTFLNNHARSIALEVPGTWNVVSPDGTTLLSCNRKWARLYSEHGELLREFYVDAADELHHALFSANGSTATIGCDIYSVPQGTDHTIILPLSDHTAQSTAPIPGYAVAIAPDGSRVAIRSRSGDQTSTHVYARDGARLFELKDSMVDPARWQEVRFAPDGSVVARCAGGGIGLWKPDGLGFRLLESDSKVGSRLSVSPDGQRIAASTQFGVAVWNLDGSRLFESATRGVEPDILRWDETGSVLFTSTWSGRTLKWSMSGELLAEIPRVSSGYTSQAITADGSTIASVSRHGLVLEDTRTNERFEIAFPNADTSDGAISRDGESLLVERDREILRLDRSGAVLECGSLDVGFNAILAGVSEDSVHVYDGMDAGTGGGVIVLPFPLRQTRQRLRWDAERAALFARAVLGDPIVGKASADGEVLLPNGSRIITAAGRTVRFSDAESGRLLFSLPVELEVQSLALSPEADRIIIQFIDGSLEVLDTRPPEMQVASLADQQQMRDAMAEYIDSLLDGTVPTAQLLSTVVRDVERTPMERHLAYEILLNKLFVMETRAQDLFQSLSSGQTQRHDVVTAINAADVHPRTRNQLLLLASEWEYSPPKPSPEERLAEETRQHRLTEASLLLEQAVSAFVQGAGGDPAELTRQALAIRRSILDETDERIEQCLAALASYDRDPDLWQEAIDVRFGRLSAHDDQSLHYMEERAWAAWLERDHKTVVVSLRTLVETAQQIESPQLPDSPWAPVSFGEMLASMRGEPWSDRFFVDYASIPGARRTIGIDVMVAHAQCRREKYLDAFSNISHVIEQRKKLRDNPSTPIDESAPSPIDLAILAMANQGLGRSEQARATLSRAREIMSDPANATTWAVDPEAMAAIAECEQFIQQTSPQ